MEAHEIAEKIHEDDDEPHAGVTHDSFRRLTAIYVGVVAMLLALATLGGGNATKEMLSANIHASDTYNFYQAKYIRQLQYELAAEQIELLAAGTGLPQEQASKATELVKRHRDTAARYESEPATGNGKKELLAKAREWEERRDIAETQNPNFEFAEAAFQIAIVLGSVAIVAASPLILVVSAVLASLGILLTINGYLLLVPLLHG